MTITELIKQLELIKAHSGDLEVSWWSLDHLFAPSLLVKKEKGGKEYLILNA
jgi:hypothetical protein